MKRLFAGDGTSRGLKQQQWLTAPPGPAKEGMFFGPCRMKGGKRSGSPVGLSPAGLLRVVAARPDIRFFIPEKGGVRGVKKRSVPSRVRA
jgi:hypothetical protein